jgi:CRISPR-associated protein (TIGR03986 family)
MSMAPKQSNPTRPRRDREGRTFWAHAPYNFVPLPETLVPAPPGLPGHDSYDEDLLTGRIDCELETCSPTYIRGLLSPQAFVEFGEKGPDELTVAQKEQRASFFASDETTVEGRPQPGIPGSSLRGMVRGLVEIIGFGRMRWVGRKPTFTFRAVAASRDDPLREPYRGVIGAFGRNVSAGYLVRRGDDWWIQPALTPKQMGWPSDDAFLKVKDRSINGRDLPAYIRLDDPRYRPQIHPVRFNVEVRRSERGSYPAVSQIVADKGSSLPFEGRLVCSGNMKEASKDRPDQRSPRRSHALVLLPDEKARTLKVRRQAMEDYKAGLTPYQREMLTDWSGERCGEMGCLGDLKPVFYVTEGNEVAYFGHSPNFRIPARLYGADRAATPPDFLPDAFRKSSEPDLADAIFGWVEEAEGPSEQRAGRVSFEDARYIGATDEGVWMKDEPITPRTLSGPKATTFQHYLVQDRGAGHDPDQKETLAHYGSTPGSTQLRGHKLYWHRGAAPDIEASAKEREHEKQLTRIVPLKPGVHFRFTVRFENLRPEELGALWWALALPGEPGKDYRHKLGMGKPLGMGAVKLTPQLVLSERRGKDGRYGRLFTQADWQDAEREADGATFAGQFEEYVLKAAGLPGAARLADVERIRMLLAMLEWQTGTEEWLQTTSYMEVEAGDARVNEYKERPVLPDPLAVVGGQPVAGSQPAPDTGSRPATTKTPPPPRPAPHEASRAAPPPKSTTPAPARTPGTLTGTVKMFNEDRGYGFIKQEDGSDIFVHHSNIVGGGRQSLRPGQRVKYKVRKGMKGPEAFDVQPI